MNQNTEDLPDEVVQAMAIEKAKLADKVEAFGASLMRRRAEAVSGRTNIGIEDDWTADEEAYQGIDDANRETVYKPASSNGSFQAARKGAGARSTVYLNITRPYVDAASARVADMLLPNDETNWDIRPTPMPEGRFKPVAQAVQQMAAPVGQPEQLPGQPAMPAPPAAIDPLEQRKEQARESAAKAKTQIEDWLVQCQWHSEVRKAIEDCARIGTGILKGPTPVKRFSRVAQNEGGMLALAIEQTIAPETKRVDPWNFYPDPACGEDIHDGAYAWELDRITAKQLRDLKGVPGYLDEQIDKVLEMGPQGAKVEAGFKSAKLKVNDSDKFEVWYFYGLAEREDLEAAGVEIPLEGDVSVPAIVTMVNDVVIKAALNPLDSGEFPYDMMPWQRRAGVPYGMGVARQINTPQRMLNAATRNMMDNAAFTAGPQMILRKGAIQPADGVWTLTPRKVWFVADGADVNAAKDAIMAINIPTQQEQLSNIIQFALKMAEDVTGLPMLMQGSQGSAPDTVGGMTIVNNNASVVLRRIIRTFDDRITEPHIKRYYEYLMLYGEDEEAKGDYQIDARGSTALIERDFQNNEAAQILQMSLNPAFGISPKKAMIEYLKSRRFDAKRFEPSEEEQAQAQQPPSNPQLEMAKLRAETDKEIATMKAQVELKKEQARAEGDINEIETKGQIELKIAGMKAEADVYKADVDTDRDLALVNSQTEQNRIMAAAKERELEIRYQIALLDYANREKLSLDKVKSALAIESAKINLTRELANVGAGADKLPKPPVEPPQKAPPGKSYSQ